MPDIGESLTNLFTKGSHHKNIDVTHIVYNLFEKKKNKQRRTLSLNSHYIVIFKNPRDMSQISYLARQMYPGNSKYMEEAYKDATTAPHGYLLLDLKQSTPDNLRLRQIFSLVIHSKLFICRPKNNDDDDDDDINDDVAHNDN